MSLLKMGNMLPPAGEIQTRNKKYFIHSVITIVIIVTWCRLNLFTMIGRHHEKKLFIYLFFNYYYYYYLFIFSLKRLKLPHDVTAVSQKLCVERHVKRSIQTPHFKFLLPA